MKRGAIIEHFGPTVRKLSMLRLTRLTMVVFKFNHRFNKISDFLPIVMVGGCIRPNNICFGGP